VSSWARHLDLVQQKNLSTLTRHWKWYNGRLCQLQLDIGSGATESLVDFNSTLDLVQRKPLSTSTRHWTWCTESLVDGKRSGEGRHSIPGCKTIAAWSWFLRMRRVTTSLPHTPSWPAHGYVFSLLIINIEEWDWTKNSVRGRKTLFFFLTEELTSWCLHQAKCLRDLNFPRYWSLSTAMWQLHL
jgi:hypothetical protein